jgi:hypothetical protein
MITKLIASSDSAEIIRRVHVSFFIGTNCKWNVCKKWDLPDFRDKALTTKLI